MPTPRLPGLPTMAALMLAATTPVIVLFTGRIPATYEVIRDFQPTIAAFVAAIAAAIAYHAATAKIRLDRETIEREHTKERLGLYIRLRAELRRVFYEAKFISDHLGQNLMDAKDAKTSDVKWQLAFELDNEYSEIESAWAKVELMPIEAVQCLDRLRRFINRARMYQPRRDEDDMPPVHVEYFLARQICLASERIVEDAEELAEIIGTAIRKLRPLDL
jgi:hypothetical protein